MCAFHYRKTNGESEKIHTSTRTRTYFSPKSKENERAKKLRRPHIFMEQTLIHAYARVNSNETLSVRSAWLSSSLLPWFRFVLRQLASFAAAQLPKLAAFFPHVSHRLRANLMEFFAPASVFSQPTVD